MAMTAGLGGRILRVSLTVANADGLARFYERALGFERVGEEELTGPAFADVMGIDSARARAVVLRLGREQVELLAFARPGARIRDNAASDDLAFQHFAIVVADMRAAYMRLKSEQGWTAISRNGPRRLPEASGGVTAFKFRDPEGHPLELLAFPPSRIPPVWRETVPRDPCLGIDHSAITVADTMVSGGFYTQGLGFTVSAQSLNEGEEQAMLDGLFEPKVEVTALESPDKQCPHLELLCYRAPRAAHSAMAMKRSNDLVATRLVITTDDVTATARRLTKLGGYVVSTGGMDAGETASAVLIRDPDGHDLLLTREG